MQSKISRALPALTAGLLLLAGCRSYTPRPLDLAAHRAAWHARSPQSERVVAFAQRLETQSGVERVFDPADGVSLPEAEVIALVFNPDLRLARARAGVAAASARHAGLWTDPVLQIDVLRITESVANPWVITPGLGITIPLSGRLDAERERADAALGAEHSAIVEAEWSVRGDVRLAWLAWSAARLRLEETASLQRRLHSLVEQTGRLAEAGELPRTEAALFALELARRDNERIRLRREVREQALGIRSLLGLAPEAPLELVPSMAVPAPAARGEQAAVEDNPTLVRLRGEYEVAEQALRREVLRQYPDLTLGPLYESDEGQSRIGFLGAIPLPILNANRQGIAEAEARRELARAAFETAFERLRGRLALASARAEALRRQREDLESSLIPLVDRQLEDAGRLLRIGEDGGLVMLESLVRAHETKLTLIELHRDEARAVTEIAQILGPPPPARSPEAEHEETP